MSVQIKAKARLQAGPVSKGEQERFKDALIALDPVFASSYKKSDYESGDSFRWEQASAALKALTVLEKNGWEAKEVAIENKFDKERWSSVHIITKNGKWPMRLTIYKTGGGTLALPTDDTAVGQGAKDENYEAALAKLAKAIMPAGFTVSYGRAEWMKRGGHAGSNAIVTCVKKAEAKGFKKEDHDFSGSPDGSNMGSGTTYRSPEGWTLHVSSSYGYTKATNSFYIILTFDARRGL